MQEQVCVTVTEKMAQKYLDDLVDYVHYTDQRVVITRKGKPWMCIVPYHGEQGFADLMRHNA